MNKIKIIDKQGVEQTVTLSDESFKALQEKVQVKKPWRAGLGEVYFYLNVIKAYPLF